MSIAVPLGEVWRLRYFWFNLAKMDVQVRYRRSVLGIGWSLLHPLAMTAVLCVVFQSAFAIETRQYAPHLIVGIAVWQFVSAMTHEGCLCLHRAQGYIRSQAMPLAIFPLRTTLGVGFHFLMTLLAAMIATWILQGLAHPAALATLLPACGLLFVLGWSVAVVVAIANTYFPDTQHLTHIGLQILFYLSPILYSLDRLNSPDLAQWLAWNPVSSILALVRDPIVHGRWPAGFDWCWSLAIAGLATGLAVLLLTRQRNDLIYRI